MFCESHRAVGQISCVSSTGKITGENNIASEIIPFGENVLRFVILIDTALNLVSTLSFAVMELQNFPPPHLPRTSQL